MALFDGDMVDVTTPDGRSLKLPASLAAQFPGLATPAPAPMPQQIGAAPISTEIAGPSVVAPPIAPPPPAVDPNINPAAQAPAGTAGVPRFDDLPSAPPPEPKPAPVPVTDAQLSKQGVSTGLNEQNAALADAAQAGRELADVEAKESVAIADAYSARNTELDQQAEKRAKDAAAWEGKVNSATTEYQSAAKAYADHKVDRSLSHPILAAISVALGALGTAMKNESKNPALDMLLMQIDKSVQLQLADRDKLGNVAAGKKSAIDLVRQQSTDSTARYNLAMAGMSEKAARQVEELKARSNSDRVKAGADVLAADLRMKGATYLDAAIGKRLELDQRDADRKQREIDSKRQADVAYARLKQDDKQFEKRLAFDKDKLAADERMAIEAAKAKGGGEGAKQLFELQKMNEERGVSNVVTGERMLQPEGQKLLAEADKVEGLAKAQRATAALAGVDPAKKAQLEQIAGLYEQKANEMRGEAAIKHTWRLGNTEQAAKVSEMVANTQTAIQLIDDISALREKHGAEWFKTEEGRKMQAKSGILELQVKEAFKLGALDKGSEAYLNRITGGDPSKITAGDITNMLGAEGNAANLGALADALEARARNDVKTKGYRGEVRFNRSKIATDSEQSKIAKAVEAEKTPLEQAEGTRNVGTARGVLEDIASPINAIAGNGVERDSELNARVVENQGDASGLSTSQAAQVNKLVADYQSGGKGAAEAKRVLVGMATSDRTTLANAALTKLQAEAPDLYAEAVKKLPDDRRKARESFDAARAKIKNPTLPAQSAPPPASREDARRAVFATQPLATLVESANGGDLESKREIVRRASAGDKEAARAQLNLIYGVR